MGQVQGTLDVTIVEGRNLKDQDIVGKNDAYVEVYLDKDYKQRTTIVKDTNNPTWNQKFTFNLQNKTDYLHLHVYDDDAVGRDSIGSARIDLKKHVFGKECYNAWITLPAMLGLRSKGEIHVIIKHHTKN
ncbi:unnamed protein product [Adineta steineri]|uniref:C2 domain-containing protein n=1 Tax=Adineta steineri TaxID=433720 RepID=A0A815ICU1_9BILA|nr:unnamed protein product [Adineta steineri]CAF1395725.1 unnamed protein product [Adineta steineri]CAF4004983.1 unnamed protein product [Adineta steineri]CAF4105831.1 unnamed protein product [Adineta steineri]